MSNISVTTIQNVIDVTETGGITVTTPEGQIINVEVPNSSVNVTNTTDDITILTAGTLIVQTGGITSVNGDTGPAVVLDTDDISQGTTNKYFSQALARQSLSAGTGISYDNSTGVITNTSINTDTTYTITSASTTGGANLNLVGSDSSTDSVAYKGSGATTVTSTDANTITIASTDTNTTYTQNASSATGGANLNLVGSDSTTDTIKFAEGTGITVVRTDADTITITNTVPDTNTTYTIASAATTGGANLTLTGSDSSTDSVAYLGSGATTVTSTDANTVTISSTDTNTTYTQNASSTTGGANLNLVGSDSTTDTIKFAGSGATTITRTDADTITVSSTDTNTTYTQNISSTTGGANLNLVGSDSTTDTVKFANGTGVTVSYTNADTATIAIGQSVGTGDSPSFAGGTFGNITVGVATDNTITTTTGDLIANSASGTIIVNSNGTLGFTLRPITGFNPNIDFTGNIVKGAIRLGESTGDIHTVAGIGYTGLSLDNTDKVTDRTGLVLRNYGGSLAAGNPRAVIITEAARGTAASPTNITSGNNLMEIQASGYTSTGWASDSTSQVPAIIRLVSTEAWSSGTSNVGTGFQVVTQPTATTLSTTSIQTTISANPQTFTARSDSYTLSKGKTNSTMMLSLADDGSGKTTLSVNKPDATSASEYSLINFNTYRSTGGTYSPTQNADIIGQFKFNGNALTGSNPGGTTGPGISITAAATETWTTGAQGTQVSFSANKLGTTTAYAVISASPDLLALNASTIDLNSFDGTTALPSGNITYGRQYIEAYSTADQTNPTANAENLMSFNNTGISNGISIVTNGTTLTRITFANAGVYNLQFSAQLSQTSGGAQNAYIWLKKNGANVANTAGDTQVAGNGDKIMASWNYVFSAAAGDYYELAWAASSTSVILDYIAAAGVVPAIPSVILTVVPIGA